MRPLARGALALVAAGALLSTGCLFTARHDLPPNVVFGKFPDERPVQLHPFEEDSMKNWALAGLLPYSRFSTRDLIARDAGTGARVDGLEIETRFGVLDTIIWVVPGFFYGYYLWAPRTLKVSGNRLDDATASR